MVPYFSSTHYIGVCQELPTEMGKLYSIGLPHLPFFSGFGTIQSELLCVDNGKVGYQHTSLWYSEGGAYQSISLQ